MPPEVRIADVRGTTIAHWRLGRVGAPVVVCLHGWPETKLIWERVAGPLADAGFDVVVPDLRGFGDSGFAPDGLYDVATHALDVATLVFDVIGADSVSLVGGDLGGPVAQEIALRNPDGVRSMVVFNCPLPFDKERMAGLRTRAPKETADYFLRQGTDADALAHELADESARIAYVTDFYTRRNWAHPGAFSRGEAERHAAPFADGDRLRATFANYESAFDPAKRLERPLFGRNAVTETLVLFGTSDVVIYPDFDLMAATVFERCAGVVRIDGCGHFVPWEQPARFLAETVPFLRRTADGPGPGN